MGMGMGNGYLYFWMNASIFFIIIFWVSWKKRRAKQSRADEIRSE